MEKACFIDRVKRFDIVGKQAMSYVEIKYILKQALTDKIHDREVEMIDATQVKEKDLSNAVSLPEAFCDEERS